MPYFWLPEMTKQITFSAGRAQKVDEHIIEFIFEKDVEVDHAISIEILGIIMTFSEGKAHSLLYNFNNRNILISDIARKFSGPRSFSNSAMMARAIISQSLPSSLEANHYVKNTDLAAETRVFGAREEAVAWLQEKAVLKLKTPHFEAN